MEIETSTILPLSTILLVKRSRTRMRSIGVPELIVLVCLGALFLSTIFYFRMLQRALERCAPECRTTSPGSVWLILIPLFNVVFQFILVGHVADSLRAEFTRRGIVEADARPGRSLGLAMCVLSVVSIIPIVGAFTGIAGFVCWILYWSKIAGYSRLIAMPWADPEPVGNYRV